MSELTSYLFHETKTVGVEVDEHGDPWFVAKDICECLGLGNTSMALERIPEDEKLTSKILMSGQARDMWLVNEPGMYRLIFTSNKPEAKAFQDWVYHEVLPSIRQTGSYGVSSTAGEKRLIMSMFNKKVELMRNLTETDNPLLRQELEGYLKWTCLQLGHRMPNVALLAPRQRALTA